MKNKFLMFVFILLGCSSLMANLPPYIGDGRKNEIKNISSETLIQIQPITVDSLSLQKINFENIQADSIKVNNITQGLTEIFYLQKQFNSIVFDKRNLIHHNKLMGLDKTYLSNWLQIYNKKYSEIQYIQPPKGLIMIAQVKMPKNIEQARILLQNLQYRKSQGFNAVLLSFDGDQNFQDLNDLVVYIKQKFKMQVWFTFGSVQDLNKQVFINPQKYSELLSNLALICDGFLANWKRTSSHLFIQDEQFKNFTAEQIRIINPNIPILGQIYFGQSYLSEINKKQLNNYIHYQNRFRDRYKEDVLISSMVKNGSGYVLGNFSTQNFNVQNIMNVFLSKYKEPKYIIISGPSVYFLSYHKTKTTYEQDMYNIMKLKQRWLKAGAWGVIITHGDGSYGFQGITDNMSQTSYKTFKR